MAIEALKAILSIRRGKFCLGAEIFGFWSVEVQNSFKRKMRVVEMAYLCRFERGKKISPEISPISGVEMQIPFKRNFTGGYRRCL